MRFLNICKESANKNKEKKNPNFQKEKINPNLEKEKNNNKKRQIN